MSEELGLVTLHCAVNMPVTPKAVEVLQQTTLISFDITGNLPGIAKLHLKVNAVPFNDPPRMYFIHQKPKIQQEVYKIESEE